VHCGTLAQDIFRLTDSVQVLEENVLLLFSMG
jgi:hypothetical protein